jgi:DNA-binding SARP family transcriptional activator
MARGHDQPSLGQVLRRVRTMAGLTQQEIAGRAGLSLRALRDLEHDRVTRPRALSMRRLRAALGLSDSQWADLLAAAGLAGTTRPVSLHVGVLGPLSLHGGGGERPISGTLPRALLGLLAVQAGQSVSRDEIVDTLWGEHPPRTCLSLVHGYAAQVRALLEPGRAQSRSNGSVVWAGGGYRLVLDRGQVDLTRFDDLSHAAAQARRDDEHELALDRYRQALACWRGPVLADAPARVRQHPAALAATGRRIAAALAHADLALELGHPEQAVAQLRPLVDTEPLHEGLHARLMLALHGQGDQAAALRLFADLRSRLAEELGIGPGPDVRAAHLRILRADRPPATPATHPAPVPAQLPGALAGFTGRAHQLAELDAILARAAPNTAPVVISAIGGTAGVGKTALAVHWAHRARDHSPTGSSTPTCTASPPPAPSAPHPRSSGCSWRPSACPRRRYRPAWTDRSRCTAAGWPTNEC